MADLELHPGNPVDPHSLLFALKLTDGPKLKGKVAELRLELNNGGKKDKNNSAKKIALKKIVANMTMSNNDMVALFPDVIGCMQIPSLEIKKMYVFYMTPALLPAFSPFGLFIWFYRKQIIDFWPGVSSSWLTTRE